MNKPKKIVLLGHFGVGKTSLLRRYVDSQFSEDYLVTVGVHVKKKVVQIDDDEITLVIWDIEGNTSLEKARISYLLGAHGFIYVFDLTRPETFAHLTTESSFLESNFPNIPVQFVGNKMDLVEGTNRMSFFETPEFSNCLFTSAKTGAQVEQLFYQLAQRTLS